MSAVRDRAQVALDGLVAKGLLGAGIVGRDGLPLLLRFSRPVGDETFGAMAAAALGAAEAALAELGGRGPVSLTIESAGLRIAVAGLDDAHILVLAAPAALSSDMLSASVEAGRKALRDVLRP